MVVKEGIKKELRTERVPVMAWVGGGVALLAAVIVSALVGNPVEAILLLEMFEMLPPIWVLGLFWFLWLTLLGFAVGALSTCARAGTSREAAFWRGSALVILAVTLAFLWYALLFGRLSLWISLLLLPLAMCLSFLAAASFWRLKKWASLVAVGYGLWLLILFFLQLGVALRA